MTLNVTNEIKYFIFAMNQLARYGRTGTEKLTPIEPADKKSEWANIPKYVNDVVSAGSLKNLLWISHIEKMNVDEIQRTAITYSEAKTILNKKISELDAEGIHDTKFHLAAWCVCQKDKSALQIQELTSQSTEAKKTLNTLLRELDTIGIHDTKFHIAAGRAPHQKRQKTRSTGEAARRLPW